MAGTTTWFELGKGSKTKSRGSILVNLTLSAEKNKHVAIQEHRHLLKLLLMHELETSQVANYWWCGKFSPKAETIRSQHAVQSGLSTFDCALSQWSVYASIHEEHPLSFNLFNSILNIIIPHLKCMQTNCEDMKLFWDGAKRILPSCFSIIRKLRAKNVSDKHVVKTLIEVLDIVASIKTFELPEDVDIFPSNVYGWLSREKNEEQAYTIDEVMIDAINIGAKEWLENIMEANRQTKSNAGEAQNDEDDLQYLIKIIQMVRSDLQRAREFFDKIFSE